MKELSAEQEDFIAKTLSNRESYGEVTLDAPKRRKAVKPKRFYQRVGLWATLVMMVPLFLSAFLIANLMRIESILGNDTVKILTSEKLPADFNEKANSNGFEWIPQYIELSKNKEIIIGGMFTVAIVIVMIMFLLEALVKRRKARKEDAQGSTQS